MARQRTLESNGTGVQVTRGARNFETGSVFRCTGQTSGLYTACNQTSVLQLVRGRTSRYAQYLIRR